MGGLESVFGYFGAKDASEAQSDSAAAASALTERMYQQNRADLAPWTKAGEEAVNTLAKLTQAGPGIFTESPSYQFALQQGMQGIQRGASATGRLGSGAYLKDITKYAEGMASQEYQNFLNRYYQSLTPYQSLAGLGQTAATNVANQGANAAQSQGQNALYAGQAQAAGILGQTNAIVAPMANAGQQVGDYMNMNYMRNLYNPQSQGQYGGYYSMGDESTPWYAYY